MLVGALLAGVFTARPAAVFAEDVYVDVDRPAGTPQDQLDSREPDDADEPEDSPADQPQLPVIQPPSQLPTWEAQHPQLLPARDDDQRDDSPGSLLDRKDIPVTQPAGSNQGDGQPRLPVSGTILNDRRCRIIKDEESGWVLAMFPQQEGMPDETPRWVLPNRMLAVMQETVADRPEVVFRVTGENTVYDERPFILMQRATIESEHTPSRLVDSAEKRPPADGEKPVEVVSDDVLGELLKDSPGEPVQPPSAEPYEKRKQPPAVAPTVEQQDVLHPGRGNMVIDRIIIVLPTGQGQWMEASFESDNTGHEPPLKILPSNMLAKAESIAAQKPAEAVRFHVSGEITEYRDQRFLLIRKLIEQRDMGGP